MMDANRMAPWLLKGAIVQFTPAAIIPIPTIVLFQYNPESISRTLQPFEDTDPNAEKDKNKIRALKAVGGLVQPIDPTETISMSIYLDASDPLGDNWPLAIAFGVQDRLSALEELMYPAANSVLGALVSSIAGAISGSGTKTIDTSANIQNVPLTLFIWGPGRIVPVRMTAFSVEEQQWTQLLYVSRAKVNISMRVLTDSEITNSGMTGLPADIASFCYKFTKGQKEVLALASLASDVEGIVSLIPH